MGVRGAVARPSASSEYVFGGCRWLSRAASGRRGARQFKVSLGRGLVPASASGLGWSAYDGVRERSKSVPSRSCVGPSLPLGLG
jgi:hypothetical protein